jgi:hypothetical protein
MKCPAAAGTDQSTAENGKPAAITNDTKEWMVKKRAGNISGFFEFS